ncbi:MAG: 2-oxo acid dehydrogenase subunit E2 [Ardenticatenaceae bacterium]|nr:2-oxo acid dehydrogenase subunit E2 [Ardenticatenaceae bacterium]
MSEFVMPSLGTDMEAGTLYEWFVKPGDAVQRGDVIASVETAKGVIDIEIFEDGRIDQLLVEPGTEVPVGTPIAVVVGAEPVAAAAVPVPVPAAAEAHPMDQKALVRPSKPEPAHNGKRVRVSPVARKLAEELGVDLSQIVGTGPNGAISRADVEEFQRRGAAAPRVEETAPPSRVEQQPVVEKPAEQPTKAAAQKGSTEFQAAMRRAIAAAMARSNREIPHYYLETRLDMGRPLAWLEAENQKRPIRDRILPVVLLIKATAKALVDVPDLNGYWVDDALRPSEAIHIGFAIALRQGGLVTPAIHHADLKSLEELMAAMSDLIMRTRAGRLRSSELTDATITLTNLGDMGVEKVYGVIYPPQVALVGFGKVMEQPWAVNGLLGVRPVLTVTLAGDHRASDGRRGGQFLDVLAKHLQEPDKL